MAASKRGARAGRREGMRLERWDWITFRKEVRTSGESPGRGSSKRRSSQARLGGRSEVLSQSDTMKAVFHQAAKPSQWDFK